MTGGARARSGPPPVLTSGRSEKRQWNELPAEGRSGPTPSWPLPGQSDREVELWVQWWARPEAVIWEADGSHDYVALTVRMFAEAEVERASAENRKTVRMMLADLYLTRDAKLRAGFQVALTSSPTPAPAPRRKSSRDRIKAVPTLTAEGESA